MVANALDIVLDYHQRTKHRFDGYAAGPEALDWDNQPAPFRSFADAERAPLPLLVEDDSATAWPDGGHAWPLDLAAIGALFQLSLSLTAWKTMGPERWAVRANPSSGNLHPVEAYALITGVAGLADGLWHYRPDDHSLECRARLREGGEGGAGGGGLIRSSQFSIILTTVPWREAWKYGERAFRYCQLDVGHAQAALVQAASLLGWPAREVPLPYAMLATLSGTNRAEDFAVGRKGRSDTETEEAELLLAFSPNGQRPGLDLTPWLAWLETATWSGAASAIDRHPLYQWPVIAQVAGATRDGVSPTPLVQPLAVTARQVLQRRSAQRFDPRHQLPQSDFIALLAATVPHTASDLHLLLFVQRVEGLAPGVYFLPRNEDGQEMLAGLNKPATPVLDVPGIGSLLQLVAADPKKLQTMARQLQCHQDLAATGSFSMGLVGRFADVLKGEPAAYRTLLREAGVLGHALYLQAESLGVRGCGIGCFFDDAVHQSIGLTDQRFQSLYHFAVGLPILDPRIETLPPYSHRSHRDENTMNSAADSTIATAPYHCIPADEAARMILDHRAGTLPGLALLDSRDAQSYQQGHVDGAMNLSSANQDRLLLKLNKEAPVIIYCYHGNSSRTHANTFTDFRFQNVFSVDGGYGPLAAALAEAEKASTAPMESAKGADDKLSAGLLAFLKEWDFDPADLNAPRKNSLTPLMRAALLGNEVLVAELLAQGVDIAYLNSDGNNALWLACVSGNGAVVQRLIDVGIAKDNRNLLGSTTLMYCASSGKADMLKLLLDNGADPLVENFDDLRAADLCATTDCLRLLRTTAR